jgi:heme exporter protein A
MLSIANLTCERDDRFLFDDLTHDFPEATITQLEGPNGAGKTTLLRILAGLYTAYEGTVLWKGKSLSECRIEFNQQLLFIGHKSSIKAGLTPLENLQFLTGLQHKVSVEVLMAALEAVGLYGYEEVLCRNLSAGQQRRVALARLYITHAKTWVLDEIFTAIDKQGVAQLEQFLVEKSAQGVTIILTTHHHLAIPDIRILPLGKMAQSRGRYD